MSAIHKYMSQEISDDERARTFSARHDTLDLILARLHADSGQKSFNSFLIQGPRGAGKTTLIHMVRQRISEDPTLKNAWLPIILPEEQIAAGSLRDLLSAILEQAREDGNSLAADWWTKSEREENDEASREIAQAGLSRLAESEGKTLLIGVENFDRVIEQALPDSPERAQLRRLFLEDPFMCFLATSTTLLDSEEKYDDPLWGHFEKIVLRRLGDSDADELISSHARFRKDEEFLKRYRTTRGIVRSLTRLTGGNPRLLLMLYDVVSLRAIDSAVEALKALVDEMTPLYNGLLEKIPLGSRKVLDAIMRAGGTAQPTEIAKTIRGMKLAEVTSHLRRLKQDGYVTVRKGGKGRAAFYSPADQFLGTWYQLRYLRGGKRRIELFVDVLRAWFAPEERLEVFKAHLSNNKSSQLNSSYTESTDYLLYSMSHTRHFPQALYAMIERGIAHEQAGDNRAAIADYTHVIEMANVPAIQCANALINRGLLKGQIGKPEEEIADYTSVINMQGALESQYARALINRGITYRQIGKAPDAIADLNSAIKMCDNDEDLIDAYVGRGMAFEELRDFKAAISDCSAAINIVNPDSEQLSELLILRGNAHRSANDLSSAVSDYSIVIEKSDTPTQLRIKALIDRSLVHRNLGHSTQQIADLSRVIEMEEARLEDRAFALVNRSAALGNSGNHKAAFADATQVINMNGAPPLQIAHATVNRGVAMRKLGDTESAVVEYSRALEMSEVPTQLRSEVLINRGIAYAALGNRSAAISDYTAIIDLAEVSAEQRIEAFLARGALYGKANDVDAEIADYTRVIDMEEASPEQKIGALISRGIAYGNAGNTTAEIADYSHAFDIDDAPGEDRANAIYNRAIVHGQLDNKLDEIADYGRAIDMIGVSAETRVDALISRGIALSEVGKDAAAIRDYTTAIDTLDISPGRLAYAYFCRGVSHRNVGSLSIAIEDFSSSLNVSEISIEDKASALFERSVTYGVKGDVQLALMDWREFTKLESSESHVSEAIQYLRLLARADLKALWPAIFDGVLTTVSTEKREALSAFAIVADTLRGTPDSKVESQPPEVRDFVAEVLSTFEPKTDEISGR